MLSIILQTERLLLRPPVAADISRFVPFLNDFDVTKNLSRLPHPYSEDDGCAWVVRTAGERVRGEAFPFIVMEKTEGRLIGICGVQPQLDFMLGYWFRKPYWGRGYATEAVRRVTKFAFDELGTNRLTASWIDDNRAPGASWKKSAASLMVPRNKTASRAEAQCSAIRLFLHPKISSAWDNNK